VQNTSTRTLTATGGWQILIMPYNISLNCSWLQIACNWS